MKHVKRTASLLLALLLTMALSVSALADGEKGSITVDNPAKDQTYTAYKIFDVTYSGDNYSYTIKKDSEWFETVKAYADKAENGLVLTKAVGSESYVVTTAEAFSAPSFAAALKEKVTGKTGTVLISSGSAVTATNLPLGYYFVTSSSGALCNLTTTNPTVTIHDKNDVPFEKTQSTASANIGETINYTITGKVPDYTGFQSYTYLITDTMTDGLTFQKNVKVTVGGVDKTTECTITYDVEGNANKLTVSIPVMDKKYTIGTEIVVTYSAVVNENAIAKIETNKAELEYSNNPITDGKGQLNGETKVHTAEIVIDKYAAGSENTKLAGAKFVLYKQVEGSTLYYKWHDTNKVEWVESKEKATVVTTDANGSGSFGGLADGNYYLEETNAPEGYNLLTAPVEVKVEGSDAEVSLTVTAKVANSTGTQLPSTGGIGTTVFYIAGAVLVIGAVLLLVTRKRMSSNN